MGIRISRIRGSICRHECVYLYIDMGLFLSHVLTFCIYCFTGIRWGLDKDIGILGIFG